MQVNAINSINSVSNLQHFEGKKKHSDKAVPQSKGFMNSLKGYAIPLMMFAVPASISSCDGLDVSASADANVTVYPGGCCDKGDSDKTGYPDVLDSLNLYRYLIGVPSDDDKDGYMAEGMVTEFSGKHEYRNKPTIELVFDPISTKHYGNNERVYYKKIETDEGVVTETPLPLEPLKAGNPYVFVNRDGVEQKGIGCVRIGDLAVHSRGGKEVAIYDLQTEGEYNGKFLEVCTLSKGYEDNAVLMEILGGFETELLDTKATVKPKEDVYSYED